LPVWPTPRRPANRSAAPVETPWARRAAPATGGLFSADSVRWGVTIDFTTPYVISPGDSLILQINHSDYGTAETPLQAFFASGVFENGLADAITSTASGTATVPNAVDPPIFVNLIIPEPASGTLLLLGGLALASRWGIRRKS
jgi:hypothetical protein